MFDGDDDDRYTRNAPPRPLWQRVLLPIVALILVSTSVAMAIKLLQNHGPSPRPHPDQPHITQVKLPPPPPPPPPPKIPPPPQQMHMQAPTKVAQPKAPPKVPSPPAAVTTSIAGPGPGTGLGVGNDGGGDVIGGDGTGGGDAGAYYQQVVRDMVTEALTHNDKLRYAHYRGTVTFVLDAARHPTNLVFQTFDGDPDTRVEVQQTLARMVAAEAIPVDVNKGRPWTVRLNAHARG